MPVTPDRPAPHVEVAPAGLEQQPVLQNLLELYAHDFSEFHPLQLGADGRFGYPQLPAYWSQPDNYPFLIKVDGNLAGLAPVKRSESVIRSGTVWDVAEFFIVRGYRQRGVGTAVAHEVWKRFPGCSEVRVMEWNRTGADFWSRAIASLNTVPFEPLVIEKNGVRWQVFAFESAKAAKD
jgi:predicted acetyltransferase